MPPRLEHDMVCCGPVTLRTLYVSGDALPTSFPAEPKAVGVSPFLRQLILRASAIPIDYDADGHDGHILAVLLGELQLACHAVDFCLLPARDRRLARVCDAIIADPRNESDLKGWASFAGTSSRTLARLFTKEFRVTFTCWRQQVRIIAALPRLASGESVTAVALDLGYETPGAFAQVFRRFLGESPSHYFKT